MKKILILIPAIILLFLIPFYYFPKYYFIPAPECKSDTSNDLSNQEFLITKLKDNTTKDYRYFFKTFKEEGEHIFMITSFRNEEACFYIKVLVDKWDKLAGMKRTNGKFYPNELYDLEWEIKSINGEEVVKYIDMHRIID